MKKLKIAEPHNIKNIEMIEKFEEKNNISSNTSSYLKTINQTTEKEEYEKIIYNSNELDQILFIEENNEIKDICHIQGERDLKTCCIILAQLKNKMKNREILSLATNYAFDYLGMNDVFITAHNPAEYELIERAGFTSLGDNEGNTIFLKQKEDLIEYNKTI